MPAIRIRGLLSELLQDEPHDFLLFGGDQVKTDPAQILHGFAECGNTGGVFFAGLTHTCQVFFLCGEQSLAQNQSARAEGGVHL